MFVSGASRLRTHAIYDLRHFACGLQSTSPKHSLTRYASLTSAISSGVRNAAKALKNAESRRIRQGTLGFWELKDAHKVTQARIESRRRHLKQDERQEELDFLAADAPAELGDAQTSSQEAAEPSEVTRGLPRRTARSFRSEADEETRKVRNAKLRRQGINVDAPVAVPYTTAASEFLYGTFAVQAALRANKRQLYKLYIWCGDTADDSGSDLEVRHIVRLANTLKIPIERVGGNWGPLLDRMCDRRPHNGLVLEASSITKLPLKELAVIEDNDRRLKVQLSDKPPEKQIGFSATESGLCAFPTLNSAEHRFPFLLFLDRITDTGNIGAILRSVYFLGADGVIILNHGTAPLNAVTVKSSAGAAEFVPIFSIENEVAFIKASRENGWKFFAAAAEQTRAGTRRIKQEEVDPNNMLKHGPCVLMLGNEATGLRSHIMKEADHRVSIKSARPGDDIVDSLNVSVAAALLAQKFLEPIVQSPGRNE